MFRKLRSGIISLTFFFFWVTQVQASEFYNYHCGYLENEDGSFSYFWSTELMGPHRYPQFGESGEFGSFIYGQNLAVCMMTEGNELPGNSMNLFVSFYEGDLLNYAPGVCSFLGAQTYLPYGEQITNEGHVIAYHISQYTGKGFLVSHRVITEPSDFKDDKCKEDLKDYF